MKQKAVVYTRVSTDKTIQKTSLITQEEYYTEYCERKGYELVKVYADEGLSGTNARRESFINILYDAGLDYKRSENSFDSFEKSTRKPKYDVLICKDVSRFSRGSIQGQTIIKHLKDKGVNTVFENSGMSTFDDNYEFNIGILFQIAQNESVSMSKRIKFSKKHSMSKGIYKPARVPFGYVRNDNNEIVIHDEQAEIVRYVFERYLEVGSSILTNELNEKEILSQQGRSFTPDKITRIISNSAYYGEATVNRTNKQNVTDTRRGKNEKSEFIKIPNAIDPIVSKELWIEANIIRESRVNKTSKRGRKPAKNDKYFAKLKCSNCGSRLVRHTGEKDKISYICQKRRKGGKCDSRSIAINIIDRFMKDVELSYMANTMSDSIYYKQLITQLEKQKLQLNETQKAIQHQIDNLNIEIDDFIDKYMVLKDGDKFKQRLIDRSNAKENEIVDLEKKLSDINIIAIDRIMKKIADKKMMIETIFKNKNFIPEEKIDLLKKVEVGNHDLVFHFSIPSYEEEVEEYNELFSMSPISLNTPFSPFSTEVFRRQHKAAREFWESVEEES